jgi:hypothetical protein
MVMRVRAYSYVISAISAAAGKEDALLPWLAPWDIQKPTDRRILAPLRAPAVSALQAPNGLFCSAG